MKKLFLTLTILALVLVSTDSVFAQDVSPTTGSNRPLNRMRGAVATGVKKRFPKAAIGSGKVSAVNGTTLTVDKDGKSYTVLTGQFEKCTTKFRRRFWGDSNISEITVGDTVNVIGRWQDDAKTTVEACLVRDTSIQKVRGVFVGTVQSLTGTGFVLTTPARGNQTVTTSSSTKFVNRKGETLSGGLSDLQVGHKLRVRGMWNRVSNTITEVTEVKDFSLPVQGNVTPTS